MKRAILGLGQAWRSEDSFGLAALEYLKQQPDLLNRDCDFLLSQGNLTDLTDYFQFYDRILIVDAVWIEEAKVIDQNQIILAKLENLVVGNKLDHCIGTHFFSLKEIYLLTKTLSTLKADIDFLGLSIKCQKIAEPLESLEAIGIFPFQEVKEKVLDWLKN